MAEELLALLLESVEQSNARLPIPSAAQVVLLEFVLKMILNVLLSCSLKEPLEVDPCALGLFRVDLALSDEVPRDGLETGGPLQQHQFLLLLLKQRLLQPMLLGPPRERFVEVLAHLPLVDSLSKLHLLPLELVVLSVPCHQRFSDELAVMELSHPHHDWHNCGGSVANPPGLKHLQALAAHSVAVMK